MIRDVFKGIFNPDWVERLDKQLKDDTNGKPWGAAQNIAIFGKPGDQDKFEFVMTGRHLTCRADGIANPTSPWAARFSTATPPRLQREGPPPRQHFLAPSRLANKVYAILDGKQKARPCGRVGPRKRLSASEDKEEVSRPADRDTSKDQLAGVEKVLLSLLEPYRKEDQEEVMACLKKQGGLEKCTLAFYQDGDLGDDGEWDNWRIEGPSFVWYFRGHPHVHIWINVADDPSVPLNSQSF